jgi:hypothetical protein
MGTADLSSRLLKGEKILWLGRPKQGLLFTPSDVKLIPSSLLWAGFTIFWEATVVSTGAPFFFVLWGIPFVLVGLHLVVGRFLLDALVRRRVTYSLTNHRVLIERAGPFPKFTALSLDQLSGTTLTGVGADGRGTIRFGYRAQLSDENWGNAWIPSLDPTPQFLAIPDAQQVFDLMQCLTQNSEGDLAITAARSDPHLPGTRQETCALQPD